jgi:hypothetical protein
MYNTALFSFIQKIQKEIEDELSFEELKVLRSVAVGIVRREEALRRVSFVLYLEVFCTHN